MPIVRVWIEDGCVSCGQSEINCPEVFKLDEGDYSNLDKGAIVVEGVDYLLYEKKIKEAAANCPVDVIKYEES